MKSRFILKNNEPIKPTDEFIRELQRLIEAKEREFEENGSVLQSLNGQ